MGASGSVHAQDGLAEWLLTSLGGLRVNLEHLGTYGTKVLLGGKPPPPRWEQLVNKDITIQQFVHALQSQESERVVVTYNADDEHRIAVRSMDLLYVIIAELAEAIDRHVDPAGR